MSFNNTVGIDEDLPVTRRDKCVQTLSFFLSPLPFVPKAHLDPAPVLPSTPPSTEPLYAARFYSGKVVLVTGASRGVGRETALQYARTGALVAIVVRTREALDETRDLVVAAVPGADVLALTADVCDVEGVRSAVQDVLQHFGKLDILIANAGAITMFTPLLNKKDPNAWWNTFEVNIRGVFNFVSAAIPALEKTQGCIIAISSIGAQLRFPGASDGCITKHAINRLVESIVLGNNPRFSSFLFLLFWETDDKIEIQIIGALEHPSVRAFALAPGQIHTRLASETGALGDNKDGGVGAPRLGCAPRCNDALSYFWSCQLALWTERINFTLTHHPRRPLVLLVLFLTRDVMGMTGSALRTGIWRSWNGIGRT